VVKELPEEAKIKLIELVREAQQANHKQAMSGLICGMLSFMACLGIYLFLVTHGYAKPARYVLGTTVLGIISGMVKGRD
jgi:hypothetical protein